ncbi:MAG: 4-demethylwyosine synthase TYW1 [Candidatus Micrarchaeia archaeon]
MNDYQARLQRAGYRFIGGNKNAAIKVCSWTKKSLTGKEACYKNAFYGIQSWRCLQLAPFWSACDNNCVHCWRETAFLSSKAPAQSEADEPSQVIEEAIAAQRALLNGFPGHEKIDLKRWKEAQQPIHCAISLMGEPTLYPFLADLIKELRKREMTSFLVSNGLHPEVLRGLAEKSALPTQLYISLNAWDAASFAKNSGNNSESAWQKFLESAKLLSQLKGRTRTVLRMTLAKNHNLCNAPAYAKIIKESECDYCEVKAWMAVGSSRERLGVQAMPAHSEISAFASELAAATGYQRSAEHKPSRVILLCRDEKTEKARFLL